jgi:hypothetical protein
MDELLILGRSYLKKKTMMILRLKDEETRLKNTLKNNPFAHRSP